MKRSFTFLTSLALLFSLSGTLSGQSFLERVAKKASKKLEQKAEEKSDDSIAGKNLENLNQTEPYDKKLSAEESQHHQMADILNQLGGDSKPLKIADKYHFSFSIAMHFHTRDKKGETTNEGEIITYTTPGETNFAYEFMSGILHKKQGPSQGLFLMDFKNNTTLILSEEKGEKTGIAFSMENSSNQVPLQKEEYDQDSQEPYFPYNEIQKTGQTKNILGYKCEEYSYSDEENDIQYWITKDLKWDTRNIYNTIFQSSMFTGGNYNGFLMESHYTDLSSGETNSMRITEIDENADKTFTPADYEIMNMGTFTMPGQKK